MRIGQRVLRADQNLWAIRLETWDQDVRDARWGHGPPGDAHDCCLRSLHHDRAASAMSTRDEEYIVVDRTDPSVPARRQVGGCTERVVAGLLTVVDSAPAGSD